MVVYAQTGDIEVSLVGVEELGGQLTGTKKDLPGIDCIAFFRDPSGNQLVLH